MQKTHRSLSTTPSRSTQIVTEGGGVLLAIVVRHGAQNSPYCCFLLCVIMRTTPGPTHDILYLYNQLDRSHFLVFSAFFTCAYSSYSFAPVSASFRIYWGSRTKYSGLLCLATEVRRAERRYLQKRAMISLNTIEYIPFIQYHCTIEYHLVSFNAIVRTIQYHWTV